MTTNCDATKYFSTIDCPLGRMTVQGDGEFVTGLYMPEHKGWRGPGATSRADDAPFTAVREQLTEYFARERQQFDVPLKLAGTPFQQRVWQELVRIPFGTTITYAELAERVGKPTASRAVGNANGHNPISILVPCHRVIGADGKLTGYAGGVERKQWLLEWERGSVARLPDPVDDSSLEVGSKLGARKTRAEVSGTRRPRDRDIGRREMCNACGVRAWDESFQRVRSATLGFDF